MAYPISLKLVSISLIIICKFNIPSVTALRCYTCDSAKDKNCQFLQTNKNPEQNCATQCFSFRSLEGTVFERGCLSSKAPCGVVSELNGDPCTKCTTDLCNSAPLAFDKCAFCNSASDLDCENTSNSTKIVECPATTAAREGCYRYSESWNGGVERGCVSDLQEETFQVCSDAQGDICKMCKGDYCNLKDNFQRCFVCDSDTHPECLNVNEQVDWQFAKVCLDYHDRCAAFVIPNGRTVRGCLNEIEPEPTYCPSTNCNICLTPDCNYGVVPATRLQCYQCNSTTDPYCTDSQIGNPISAPFPCNTFKFDDQCYTYWDDASGIGYRGCLSDRGAIVEECERNPMKCLTCSSYSCNSEYILRDPQLWCIQCEGTAACMWSFRTPTRPCANQVAFYENESCYQHLSPSGLMATRGCTLDDPHFCTDKECQVCSNYFCNGASYMKQSCIRCTSTELCEREPSEIEGEICPVDPTYTQRGCYSFRDEAGALFRGCYNEMKDDWRTFCETSFADRCTRCYGDNCNTNYQGIGHVIIPPKALIECLLTVIWMFALYV